MRVTPHPHTRKRGVTLKREKLIGGEATDLVVILLLVTSPQLAFPSSFFLFAPVFS